MQTTQNTITQSTSKQFLQEQARLLSHAASDNDLQQVQCILDAYPDVVHVRGGIMQSTPMHFAADRGFIEIVIRLIDAGADVNAKEGATGTTPIHWAALSGQIEVAKLLISHQADIESTDDWHNLAPLGWAAAVVDKPHTEMIDYLLDQGARMDLFTALLSLTGGYSLLLHLAARENLYEATSLLLNHGADPNATASMIVDELLCQVTPLHRAALLGHAQTVCVLLEHGANPNQPTIGYWNVAPLHLAAWRGHAEAARLLVEFGADPLLKDRHGLGTPLEWATDGDKEAIIVLLTPLTNGE